MKKSCSEGHDSNHTDIEFGFHKSTGEYHQIVLKCFDCGIDHEHKQLRTFNKRQRRKQGTQGKEIK